MAEKGYVLTEQDVRILTEMLRREKSRRIPQRYRDNTIDNEEMMSPQLYVVRTPAEGIVGLVGLSGTETGTGTSSSIADNPDQPGYANCYVYRVIETRGIPTLIPVSQFFHRVYNLSHSSIPGNQWIPVGRDSYGSWISLFEAPRLFPAYLTDRSVITGWHPTYPTIERYAYSWTELQATEGGRFQALPLGRTGTASWHPAFEMPRVNEFYPGANTPLNSIVWLQEGAEDPNFGRSYHFSAPNTQYIVEIIGVIGVGNYYGKVLNASNLIAGLVEDKNCIVQSLNGGALILNRKYIAFYAGGNSTETFLVYDDCGCPDTETGTGTVVDFPQVCFAYCSHIWFGEDDGGWGPGINACHPREGVSGDDIYGYYCVCGNANELAEALGIPTPTDEDIGRVYALPTCIVEEEEVEPTGTGTSTTSEPGTGTGDDCSSLQCRWEWNGSGWDQTSICLGGCTCATPVTTGLFIGDETFTDCVP